MIINKLRVENWKVFDNKEFEFTPGVNIIEGKNYSGKTSFIQALYFALFNESLYKQLTVKELKKENQKDATIVFDFSVDGQEYRIRRNISGEKIVRTDSYLYRLDNGKEVEELESISRRNEELSKIEDLLKISKNYVKRVNFIQEDSIPYLLNNPKLKILDDIFNILQLDYFTELNGYCTQIIKDLEKKENQMEAKYSQALELFDTLEIEIKGIQSKNIELKEKLDILTNNVNSVKKRIQKYSKIELLIQEQNTIENELKIEEERKNSIINDIKERIKDLEIVKQIEKEIASLEEKSEAYLNGECELEILKKEKDLLKDKFNQIQQHDILLKDKKSQLHSLESQLKDFDNVLRGLEGLKKEVQDLEAQYREFNTVVMDIKNLENKIENEKRIQESFKEGSCPITEELCPVSNNFIIQYTESLDKLYVDKQNIEKIFSQLRDPIKELNAKIKEKEKLEKISEKRQDVIAEILKLKQEIVSISKNENEEDIIHGEIVELENKIKRLADKLSDMKRDHQNYIIKKEKVKDKVKIEDWINNKNNQKKEIDLGIEELKKKVKSYDEKIKKLKSEYSIDDVLKVSEENSELEKLENEYTTIKVELKTNEFKIQEKEKNRGRLVAPYKSPDHMFSEIEKLVHNYYKVIFFQDALNLTFDELKTRKLKSIKDQCNKMWIKFHTKSGKHLIDWDENFVPILRIGDIERNFYQLSSSEKMFIYFSIRATLLSELGPNRFIVIDNLLNPFMIENQKFILDQIKKIVEESNIEQIIFTGFDISPDVKGDNRIII